MPKYGINDMPELTSVKVGNKHVPHPRYRLWHNLMSRVHEPRVAHYFGLSICEDWLTFSKFNAWVDEHFVEGYSLDKDILHEGNMCYGPEYCIFVPQWVNTIAITPNRKRDLPTGVYRNGKGYMAQLRKRAGNSTTVGTYSTPMLAYKAYLQAKGKYIKELKVELDAIDIRLYPALFEKYRSLWLSCQ